MASQNKDHKNAVTKVYNILKSEGIQIDKRVVDAICYSSSEFTSKLMRDPEDTRPVRWMYWGIFAMRKGLKKRRV